MPTTPELLTDWVIIVVLVGELEPPQPALNAVAANTIRQRLTADHMPCAANFLRRKNSGSRRIGSTMNAEDVLATLSSKTTVTW